MYTLVTFATQWGSRYGGINTFNADFVTRFAFAYQTKVQTICIVSAATPEQIQHAEKSSVRLVPLPYVPDSPTLAAEHGKTAVARLRELGVHVDEESTIWLVTIG